MSNNIILANQALENSDREEVKNTANEIIAAQSKEIEQMKQWEASWYGNR